MNQRRRRHWVIGDVHGCYQPLRHLLDTLPPNDHLVFCGDVINRGEAIPVTVDLIWHLIQAGRATWLRGNHEQDHIESMQKHTLALTKESLSLQTTYAQMGDSSACQWLPRLQQLPLVYRGDGWCATHAGFNAAGQPDLSIRDPFWESYDGRFGLVVVGHTPRPQVQRLGSIVLIDTGAVYGGFLSAYCPETDAIVQVEGAATDAVLAGGASPC